MVPNDTWGYHICEQLKFVFFFLDYQLQNSVMQTVSAESQITCANHCALHDKSKCKSFNFIVDSALVENCELSSKAALTTNDANLVPRTGALYFEKIKEGGVNLFARVTDFIKIFIQLHGIIYVQCDYLRPRVQYILIH